MSTIHIVGGGIAGLTLAATLRRPDWDIVLHEQGRRPEEREVGTALGLWPAAMAALDRIGLGRSIREQGVHASKATIRSADGRLLTRLPEQDVVMIGRTDLHRMLRGALPASVRWRDARVPDGRALAGDVIVGADGVHSVVRRDHWGDGSAARPRRTTVLRGVIDGDHSGGEVTEYWGNGRLFGISPVAAHRTNWFTAFPEQRFDGVEDGLRHLRRAVRDFPAPVRETVAAAEAEQTLVNGISVSRNLLSSVRGRAVLIGDAAHAMTPSLGRGACESMLDAVALGALLNRHRPAEALRRYRRRRLVAPQLIRAASSMVMNVSLASGRRARVRDGLLRAIGRS